MYYCIRNRTCSYCKCYETLPMQNMFKTWVRAHPSRRAATSLDRSLRSPQEYTYLALKYDMTAAYGLLDS
jgi:hypothetical protein